MGLVHIVSHMTVLFCPRSVSPISAEPTSSHGSPTSPLCPPAPAKTSPPVMPPVPPRPDGHQSPIMPTSSKKAKGTAPAEPDTMPPPSVTPLKKAKTEALLSEKACAVKGGVVGRPPATPQAKAPASLTAHLPMPPPPKARDPHQPPPPAAPPAKPLGTPNMPAYVNAPCGVPKASGVKMEAKPSQAAAAALRRLTPRPTTKVEVSEQTIPVVPKMPAPPTISKPAPICKAPAPSAPITTTSSQPAPAAKASSPHSKANTVPPAPGAPHGNASSLSTRSTPQTGGKACTTVPPETTKALQTPETELEQEQRLRNWVAKMDEVEIKQRIEKIKRDPTFPQFEQWLRTEIFDLPPEEQLPEFGENDEEEELISFLVWSENPASKPSPENSMPDPNPAETAAVAVATPRAVTPDPMTPDGEAPEPRKKVTFSPEVVVHTSPAVHTSAAAPTATPTIEAAEPSPPAGHPSPPASILKAPEAKAASPAGAPAATPPANSPASPASSSNDAPAATTTVTAAAAAPSASSATHSTALVPAGSLASQIQVHAPVSQID